MKLKILLNTLGLVIMKSYVNAAVTIDWAYVGDAGNAADNSTGSAYGAVDHNYKISKHEVTVGQYTEFLNAVAKDDVHGLYDPGMGMNSNVAGISRSGSTGNHSFSVISGAENLPITYVSWEDAARFVNWMANGQGTASTETGVYDMNLTDPIAAIGAGYWIPSESEWYKAAYYDPTLGNADDGDNYHLYATQSSSVPSNDLPDAGNNANFDSSGYTLSGTNKLTDVGSFVGSASYYGTFDQNGNLAEWNDALTPGSSLSDSARGLRGGSWQNVEGDMRSSSRYELTSYVGTEYASFRIASIPEPSSVVLILISGFSFLLRRKRS
mgnify:CR=1 FL=1